MGYAGAKDMIEHGGQDAALRWHLTANCYPPIPVKMLRACKTAIHNAGAGLWDKLVLLPSGCKYKGQSTAPTAALVEQHHLEAFLDGGEA